MTTMKAIRIHAFGGPEVLLYEDAPKPELKPGEVLVRVHAAGINPPDWYVRDGMKVLPPEWRPLPRDNQGETAYCLTQVCSRADFPLFLSSDAMPRIAQLSFLAWLPDGGARRRRQGWPSHRPQGWRRRR
jgi:hypothetical protein